jgi:hypothetical protein
MATFIRRSMAKIAERADKKGKGAEALTFSRPEGMVTLSAREASRYGMLMTMLDSDGDNEVGGMEGASFLRRSGLDTGASRRRARRRGPAARPRPGLPRAPLHPNFSG